MKKNHGFDETREIGEASPLDLIYYGNSHVTPNGSTMFENFTPNLDFLKLWNTGKLCSFKLRQATEEECSETPEKIYWGWLVKGHKSLSYVHPTKRILSMCFADGVDREIAAQNGVMFKLAVEKIRDIE